MSALVYIGFGAVLFFAQKSFIYYPTPAVFGECEAQRDNTEALTLPDGARGYLTDIGSDSIVVLYHGNAGSACDRIFYANVFELAGYSSLIVEYAGYGSDPRGAPSARAILDDAQEIAVYIQRRDYTRVVLMGKSLGAAVASYHASLFAPEHLILVTPFVSLAARAQELYPLYPAALLLRERFDTHTWASVASGTPLTIIHGSADTLIPPHHAHELYNTLPHEDKTLTIIEHARHNNLIGFDAYWETLQRALE